MTDVVFVQPPIRDVYLTAKRTVPYGLIRMAASLRAAGYTVALVDALATRRARRMAPPTGIDLSHALSDDRSPFALFRHYQHFGRSVEAVAKAVAAHHPRVIGVSMPFSAYAELAQATIEAIRARCPEAVIVVGGHHATALPEMVLADPGSDFVLRGEGEEALPKLVDALLGGHDPRTADVPGLCWRDERGVRLSAPAEVRDLGALPPPAFDLVEQRHYAHAEGARVVIVTSRGCKLRCRYCAFGGPKAPSYRQSTLEAVLEELDVAIERHGARFVDFEDENLGWDRPLFLALLRAIVARYGERRIELRAMNGLLPRTLDSEVVAAMAEAGFRVLNLALGSSRVAALHQLGRPDERIALDRALALAEQLGLEAVAYLVAGAPGQTPESSVDDLLYLAKRRTLVGLSLYYPAPGSALFAVAQEQGSLPTDPSAWRSTAMSKEGATLLRLARVLNFIKAELDVGRALPSPSPIDDWLPDGLSRVESGRRLLAAFLHDRVLRGVGAEGNVYPHEVCDHLTNRFLDGLRSVAGVRSNKRIEGRR